MPPRGGKSTKLEAERPSSDSSSVTPKLPRRTGLFAVHFPGYWALGLTRVCVFPEDRKYLSQTSAAPDSTRKQSFVAGKFQSRKNSTGNQLWHLLEG